MPTLVIYLMTAKYSAYSQFRVTRDSDLWVDEDEVKNLRQALQGELQGRQLVWLCDWRWRRIAPRLYRNSS